MKGYTIKLKNLSTKSNDNYKSIIGNFEILNNKKNTKEDLKPEIRFYNQPQTITYEASIKTNFFSDTYITMSNISNTNIFNIKFQKKPFMNFIWISVLIISFGAFYNFITRVKKI